MLVIVSVFGRPTECVRLLCLCVVLLERTLDPAALDGSQVGLEGDCLTLVAAKVDGVPLCLNVFETTPPPQGGDLVFQVATSERCSPCRPAVYTTPQVPFRAH